MVSSDMKTFRHTVSQNNQEYRLKNWATRLSVRLFAHTSHSFACSVLLVSLLCSVALTRSLAHYLVRGTVNDQMAIYSVFFSIVALSVFEAYLHLRR